MPLSPHQALGCAILYTILYIAPFYLSATLRTTALTSRDAPAVIRARVRTVALTCLLSSLLTLGVHATTDPNASVARTLHLLGLWPAHVLDILRVLGLLSILFAGPLYESLLIDEDWRDWSLTALRATVWDSWTGYRNLLIAPVSEEWVFRSQIVSLYLLAGAGAGRIVLTTPLIFGGAHVHHLVELVRARTPPGCRLPPTRVLVLSVLQVVFMFAYTALFGFFAAFVYLRTGSLWAATLAHSFCNWQGFPRVMGRVGQFATNSARDLTPDVAQGKEFGHVPLHGDAMVDGNDDTTPTLALGPQDLSLGWTVMYYALLLVGSYGFYRLLWPMTDSSNALAEF